MFVVNDDRSIYATRGDTIFFRVTAKDHGTPYIFKPGDIVRMSVTAKKDVGKVYLQKDFPVYKATKTVFIYLEERDTNFGKKMNKHEDFWYEIVLNPDTVPQTIIGYDDDGPKIFRVYPDAEEIDPALPEPEEIPVVDAELDLTSHRPVSNHAVSVAIAKLTAAVEELKGTMPEEETPAGSVFNAAGQVEGLSIVTIDAYGVAVRNGYEGTEEEWLVSLIGKQGETGKPGENGYTPVRGVDYWREEDRQAILDEVLNSEEVSKLQKNIDDLRADMNYVAIDITSISNDVGTVEMGVKVTEMTVTWKLNKTPAGQTLGGESVDVSTRSKTVSMEGRTSVTLAVTDERGAKDSASTGYNSYNGVYYGAAAIPETLDSAFILSLCKPVLTSSRARTITVNAADGQYIWYALPVRLGKCSFAVGGFVGGFDLVDTIDFANSSDYTEQYYIYRSTNLVPGETKVVIS